MNIPITKALREQHAKAGLILGWFGFFVFVLGAISLYRHELTFWAQTETHRAALAPDRENRALAARAGLELAKKTGSPEGVWLIALPTERNPVPSLALVQPGDMHDHHHWAFKSFDAGTGEFLTARETCGGNFLYRLHVDLFGLGPAGRKLVAFLALCMLAVLLSGVFLRKNLVSRMFSLGKSGARMWYEGHCVGAGATLPFAALFIVSGLVLASQSFLPATLFPHYREDRRSFVVESKGIRTTPDAFEARAIYAAGSGQGDRVRERLERLLLVAEKRWDSGPGLVSFRFEDHRLAEIEASEARGTLFGRRTAGERLTASMESGDIVTKPRGREPGVVATLWYAASALHLGRFADPFTRLFMCLSALCVAGSLAMGLVLRERKGRAAVRGPASAITTWMVIGLPTAMAGHLLATRLLDPGLAARPGLEKAVFFAIWGASLVHALLRDSHVARFEQLVLASVATALLTLQAMFGQDPGPLQALFSGLPVLFGTALMFLAATIVAIFCTFREWERVRREALARYTSLPGRLWASLATFPSSLKKAAQNLARRRRALTEQVLAKHASPANTKSTGFRLPAFLAKKGTAQAPRKQEARALPKAPESEDTASTSTSDTTSLGQAQ